MSSDHHPEVVEQMRADGRVSCCQLFFHSQEMGERDFQLHHRKTYMHVCVNMCVHTHYIYMQIVSKAQNSHSL